MFKKSVFFFLSLLVLAEGFAASSSDEEELMQAYGGKDIVSIATGARQPLIRAPAAATVITAADILAMGATDLDQILETVPGLHVSFSPLAYTPIYLIRGIHGKFNPHVLMMLNGISITDMYVGDRGQALGWGGMPIANIARIEVIRGPGSALYGADAFAGVINVITKTAADIQGLQIGARAGSFNTRDVWLLHSGSGGGWESTFSLDLHNTDGHREIIAADAQTSRDPPLGPRVSLAPGSVNTQRNTFDIRLDLSKKDWRMRLGYQGRRNLGTGAGVAQALDPRGSIDSDRFNADLSYDNPKYAQHWGVSSQLSYFDTRLRTQLVLFPPGAFNNAFPEGMIGNPSRAERHTRLGGSIFYTGIATHKFRLGIGLNEIELYQVSESKNFYFVPPSPRPVPLPGGLRDVSYLPDLVYIQKQDRHNYYAYLQDEWFFAPDWELTAGVRYDEYSDFSRTVNPRLALVWQTSQYLTSKLLYGRAFRAPSFAELYIINNPVSLGNPNLSPEVIDTYELAFNYQASQKLRTNINLFYYKMKGILRFIPDPLPATTTTAQNSGSQTGHGLEWEGSWAVTQDLELKANFALQRSIDDSTDGDVGYAPRRQVYLRADLLLAPAWHLDTQINRVIGRHRPVGDSRSDIRDYSIVDLTLRRVRVAGNWSIAAALRNLFDADAREPSPSPGAIPNDLPLPGRNVYLELRYGL